MITNPSNKCTYGGSPIEAEQSWVREKVYELLRHHEAGQVVWRKSQPSS
jgi:hypothetical protein